MGYYIFTATPTSSFLFLLSLRRNSKGSMKIIVPMAGIGKRMRPHTLTTPKPLIPVAGKPIVHRLVEDLAAMYDEPLEEIAFITGRFGKEAEKSLIKIAEKVGARGKIY